MRIIYLHQYFVTPDQPGGTRSYEIARRMVAAGHEVHMVSTYRKTPAPAKIGQWLESDVEGIHLHQLVNPYDQSMSYAARIRSFLRYALQSMRRATSLRGDLIYATSTPLTVAIPALYASKRNRIPMIFEVRDLWPEGPIAVGALRNPLAIRAARWLERKAYFGAANVVALSPDMVKGVKATGYPEDRILLIPNGSDTGLFRVPPSSGEAFLREHPHLAEGPLLVYCGSLGVLNGIDYLIQLAAHMSQIDPSVRFLVVGYGRDEENLVTEALKLGIYEKNLWFMTRIPKRELPPILSACKMAFSLFINHPYTAQNSPNKAFDTFAAGRPLAVNHSGWIAELISQTGAGLTLPPGDPCAAARSIRDFLADPARQEKACAASAHLGSTRFERNRLVQDLLDLIEDLPPHHRPAQEVHPC
ncbi:MAG TPA: glycosyltransferase family 4 protein [Kiritimatiellia bacterium]|nr:glycosyltransferase family 4 protein [Kiritimatiellia bacterium]